LGVGGVKALYFEQNVLFTTAFPNCINKIPNLI